jgi:hypothetical protein
MGAESRAKMEAAVKLAVASGRPQVVSAPGSVVLVRVFPFSAETREATGRALGAAQQATQPAARSAEPAKKG